MKKFKRLLLFMLMTTVIAGCKYDDGELWDKVNSLDNRLTQIETQMSQMNAEINSISTIINALQNKVYVTSVKETENGYQITFSDGKTIKITNGKDGENGKDAPVIGIDEYEGKYYWTQTINGTKSWLTDKDGAKIPAAGTDGITPIVKVNKDGYWEISYDKGKTFALLLDDKGNPIQAVGKNGSDGLNGSTGDSFFKSVKVEGSEVVITLIDGTTFRLPIS